MATMGTALVPLAEVQHDQEVECFAILAKKVRGMTKRDQPFLTCHFRDKKTAVEAPIWSDHRLYQQAQSWVDGIAYRIRARGEQHPRFGMQLKIIELRPASDELDGPEGYSFHDLVESSKYAPQFCYASILTTIDKYITDPALADLVKRVLDDNAELFQKLPAAQSLHHGFVGGLIEHVWSVTRVASMLASHYANYYNELNPPLNKGVIVAAAILHDIGKLRELEFSAVEVKYTKQGNLIGHILIGRDMVREAARHVPGLDEETLLLLEHAILAHHGKPEYGAPKAPATLEAMIVHYADELDAKINAVVRESERSQGADGFTEKVYAVDNRRFYRGLKLAPPAEEPSDLGEPGPLAQPD